MAKVIRFPGSNGPRKRLRKTRPRAPRLADAVVREFNLLKKRVEESKKREETTRKGFVSAPKSTDPAALLKRQMTAAHAELSLLTEARAMYDFARPHPQLWPELRFKSDKDFETALGELDTRIRYARTLMDGLQRQSKFRVKKPKT